MPLTAESSVDDHKIEYLQACAEDIRYFAQEFCGHLLTSQIPEFHKEIYKIVRPSENKRLVIAAPRGFAKSYLCSIIYPIWLGCFGVYKEVTIISASETLAKEMLRKVKREFEVNKKLEEYFGKMITDKWSEIHAVTATGTSYRARGAEGQVRGFRPECIILDDLETDESVRSEEQRKKLYDWIMRACLPALVPNGQLLLIGSILSPMAVLKQILDTDNGWEKRIYRAYKTGVEQAGDELWLDLWPHHKLQQRKREIGSSAFASEYMNDPRSSDSNTIQPELIRRWKELPTQLSCVITVDPAYSEDARSDHKVACLVGIDQQMNRYLVSYLRTHAPQGEFIDAVLNMWMSNRNTVTSLGIPCQGTESEIFRSFINRATDRKVYPPFAELKNTFVTSAGVSKRGKAARIIASLQPLFEQGKYYIGESHSEAYDELVSLNPELTQRWDDIIDCMAYAESLIQPVFMTNDEENKWNEPKKMPNDYGY